MRTCSKERNAFEVSDLLGLYRTSLYTSYATTPSALRKAYRLRYQVYCIERGYEDACNLPAQLEKDSFDKHAKHFIAGHRPTGHALGVTRLILDRPGYRQALPIETHGSLSVARQLVEVRSRSGTQVAEVSRLGVTKQLRQLCTAGEQGMAFNSRHVFMGLLAMLCRQSWERGVTHWVALSGTVLLRVLDRLGLHFHPIGSLIEHRGCRQPVMASVEELWHNVNQQGNPLADLIRAIPGSMGVRQRSLQPSSLPSQPPAIPCVG